MPSFVYMRLIPALIGMIAGTGLCITIINRFLGQPGLKNKKPFILPFFLLLVGGMGIYGYATRFSVFTLLPVAIICGLMILEIQRILYWRVNRGAPPVEWKGSQFSLFRPITTTDLMVARYEILLSGWNGTGLRVVHLSDLHITDRVPLNYYHKAIQQVNQASPDLVFFTGDFITDICFEERLSEVLKGFSSDMRIYAIFGNHDYWSDPKKLRKIAQEANIQLINNGWRRIHFNEQAKVMIQGCENPWSDDRWLAPGIQNGELNLALSHTADNISQLSKAGAHVVFSGHYHAGQFQAPGFGPIIVPSKYGRRYYHGHFLVNSTHLFVSAGVGVANPAFRIYCQPDIFIIDINGRKGDHNKP